LEQPVHGFELPINDKKVGKLMRNKKNKNIGKLMRIKKNKNIVGVIQCCSVKILLKG
jgi:hypothetical protein